MTSYQTVSVGEEHLRLLEQGARDLARLMGALDALERVGDPAVLANRMVFQILQMKRQIDERRVG